ncbi:PIN domain-like protein [Moniliophthora roreri]|nr:PIN domain-like protein [Moniliophthora roreri]
MTKCKSMPSKAGHTQSVACLDQSGEPYREGAWSTPERCLRVCHPEPEQEFQSPKSLRLLGRCFGTSLFTYDGDEWQSVKGGIAVVQDEDEILLYWCSRPIIEAFGYHCHNAPGDAEAELAVMNQMGIIDAVLTRDADIFPLGAKDETTEVKLVVDIFHADVISEKLGLT